MITLDKKETKLLKQLVFLYITNPDLELDPDLEDILLRLLYKLEWGD